MIVVSDTSVILNLCCLGHTGLLPEIFGEVLAPPSVAEEFKRLASVDKRFQGLVFPLFVRVVAPVKMARQLSANRKLHTGEIDALSLAVEQQANAVLMDESAGRAAAAGLGLRCVGILGILIQAKNSGLLSSIAPVLDELELKAGFWISPSLRKRVLDLVNE